MKILHGLLALDDQGDEYIYREKVMEVPLDPTKVKHINGRIMARPIELVTRPVIDPVTEVMEGPNDDVQIDKIVRSWAKRLKTQAELDADTAAANSEMDRLTTEAVEGVVGKAMFKIVNEIRILQSQLTLSPAQFKTWFRNQQT